MPSIPLHLRLRGALAVPFRLRLTRMLNEFLDVARHACRETQEQTLQRLLQLNSDSRFSHEHDLRPGLSVTEFRSRIPVSDYTLIAPWIDRMTTGDHRALLGSRNRLRMYAVTSGTTARSKLIPVTDRFVEDYRRGWQHWGVQAHMEYTKLRTLKMVQVASSHRRFAVDDGTPCGNISGLVTAMQRKVVRLLYSLPAEVAHLQDPAAKRDAVVRFAISDPWVGILVTANPSTLLQMAEYAAASAESLIRDIHDGTARAVRSESDRQALRPFLRQNPRRARELEEVIREHGSLKLSACWPHLTCLGVWSGGSAGAYIPQLRQTFGDIPLRDHGLHASEGRMTIPIHANTAAGILDIESHFFEFIPIEDADATRPNVLGAHELMEGREYLILLTTSSGLYRYNILDVVRCTGFHGTTPMLEFRHKGAHISSITGEKIAESQVVEAVRQSCDDIQVQLDQYTLSPRWGEPPGYTLFVAADDMPHAVLERLAETIDRRLCERNCEYGEKRETRRLDTVEIRVVPSESWQQFTQKRLGIAGGSSEQYKHPCLLPDPHFEQLFLRQCGLANAETRTVRGGR